MKCVAILGSTGSIGTQTLDILRGRPDLFKVVFLLAGRNEKLLSAQKREFGCQAILAARDGKQRSQELLEKEIQADLIVNAVDGSLGLEYSLIALRKGVTLLLANKESLVIAGEHLLTYAKHYNSQIIPLDSEHQAAWLLMQECPRSQIKNVYITASGGALRDYPLEKLSQATLADALQHPNWTMGAHITVSSATMANKALEIFEAMALFHLPGSQVKAVIQRESLVHAMLQEQNGNFRLYASPADMHIPIGIGLFSPESFSSGLAPMSFSPLDLHFDEISKERYPLFWLGRRCAETGDLSYAITFSIANERAVQRFIDGEISYGEIATEVKKAISELRPQSIESAEQALAFYQESARKI